MCAHLRLHAVKVAAVVPAGGVRAAIASVVVLHWRRSRPCQLNNHRAHDVVVVVQAAETGQLQQCLSRQDTNLGFQVFAAIKNAICDCPTSAWNNSYL